MIERYTLPEMGRIWSEENRLQKWLEVEIYACEAQARLGNIPGKDLEIIKKRANFNVERIKEIEAETHHDVIAFLTNVAEYVGDSSKYIHLGMTSSDVLDTALAVQLKESCDLLLDKLHELRDIFKKLARKHKFTLMVGRTHGIHGEPVTFGLKMALWTKEAERGIARLERAKETVSTGKISGAVGTFANIDPYVEEYVCEKMGLTPAPVSTQIVQRDRHAEYLTVLSLIACSLEKWATEIRNLQRTEILEVEERFARGQKGSSAMPHKKNPIIAERVTGLARNLRGNAIAGLENIALWHERDLTHSSVERIILPDSSILLDYMLFKFINIMKDLVVHEKNMKRNLEKTLGLVFSQRVMLALVEKGVLRETAYSWVQRNALKAWESGISFKELILKDADITRYLQEAEIDLIFNYDYHLKNIDFIFRRAGIEEEV